MAAPRLRPRPDLRTRFAKHLPQLLDAMVEQLTMEVEYYQHLGPDASARAAEGTHRNLALFIRLLQEDRPPRPDEVELIMRAAASRAQDRMPLSCSRRTSSACAHAGSRCRTWRVPPTFVSCSRSAT